MSLFLQALVELHARVRSDTRRGGGDGCVRLAGCLLAVTGLEAGIGGSPVTYRHIGHLVRAPRLHARCACPQCLARCALPATNSAFGQDIMLARGLPSKAGAGACMRRATWVQGESLQGAPLMRAVPAAERGRGGRRGRRQEPGGAGRL